MSRTKPSAIHRPIPGRTGAAPTDEPEASATAASGAARAAAGAAGGAAAVPAAPPAGPTSSPVARGAPPAHADKESKEMTSAKGFRVMRNLRPQLQQISQYRESIV